MSNADFPLLVKKQFEFLFSEHGFSVQSEIYTASPLAEWRIVLCSKSLCIEISLDKSQVMINLGIPDKRNAWFDLMYIMMFITKNLEWEYRWFSGKINSNYYERQLRYLSRILEENYEQIESATAKIVNNKDDRKRYEKLVREFSENHIYKI